MSDPPAGLAVNPDLGSLHDLVPSPQDRQMEGDVGGERFHVVADPDRSIHRRLGRTGTCHLGCTALFPSGAVAGDDTTLPVAGLAGLVEVDVEPGGGPTDIAGDECVLVIVSGGTHLGHDRRGVEEGSRRVIHGSESYGDRVSGLLPGIEPSGVASGPCPAIMGGSIR